MYVILGLSPFCMGLFIDAFGSNRREITPVLKQTTRLSNEGRKAVEIVELTGYDSSAYWTPCVTV